MSGNLNRPSFIPDIVLRSILQSSCLAAVRLGEISTAVAVKFHHRPQTMRAIITHQVTTQTPLELHQVDGTRKLEAARKMCRKRLHALTTAPRGNGAASSMAEKRPSRMSGTPQRVEAPAAEIAEPSPSQVLVTVEAAKRALTTGMERVTSKSEGEICVGPAAPAPRSGSPTSDSASSSSATWQSSARPSTTGRTASASGTETASKRWTGSTNRPRWSPSASKTAGTAQSARSWLKQSKEAPTMPHLTPPTRNSSRKLWT